MSLQIYLDDCAYAKQLVVLLRSAGHQVVTPAAAKAGPAAQAKRLDLPYPQQAVPNLTMRGQ